MKKLVMLTMILGTMSTMAMADARGGYEGQLSFIPKITIGENRSDDDMEFKVKGFAGFNADILYGVNQNLEMGINLGWSQYDLNDTPKEIANFLDEEFGITPSKNDWDKTLDNLSLVGVVRYNFTELDLVTPYITGRAGWSFGKASGDIEFSDNGNDYTLDTEISGRWIAGIAVGAEYENFNVELGYQVTKYEITTELDNNSIISDKIDESDKTDIGLIYVSLGYRFE